MIIPSPGVLSNQQVPNSVLVELQVPVITLEITSSVSSTVSSSIISSSTIGQLKSILDWTRGSLILSKKRVYSPSSRFSISNSKESKSIELNRWITPSSFSHCERTLSTSPSEPINFVSSPQAESHEISSVPRLTICGETVRTLSPETSAVISKVSLSQFEALARLRLMDEVSKISCSGISIITIISPGDTMHPSCPINVQSG